ncbi:AAA family ATPase [Shewanella japonica]|nr:ATP-binding protein [Shewanella japonica]
MSSSNKNIEYAQIINKLRFRTPLAETFEVVDEDTSQWCIYNLKPLNFFIGSNNSGKSRLLREIFSNHFQEADSDVDGFGDLILSMRKNFKSTEYAHVLPILDKLIAEGREFKYSALIEELKRELEALFSKKGGYRNVMVDAPIEYISNQLVTNETLSKLVALENRSFEKYYIPMLRGLRNFSENEDHYKARTMKDYFDGKEQGGLIFTGHSLYEDLKNALLGSYSEREKVRGFENYLSTSFFQGTDLSLVPRFNDDVVHFKIGDRDERPIYDLGDGLQALIIITFAIFMADKPTMFCIEEPEQHLHAGMQRALVELMSSHKQHMYFMTTHSNHFIDIAREKKEIGLQRVWQAGEDKTRFQSILPNVQLLEDLGVRASSVLLANCSIWVEGVTDKLYLKAYMEKYLLELESSEVDDIARSKKLRSFQEDLHFVFTEYQGSNITHWNFGREIIKGELQTAATAFSSKILLIADNDIANKGDRVKELTDQLGDNFYLLEFKEIENYLPSKILETTALERWDTFKERGDSKLIIDAINSSDYQKSDIGIGTFLENFVIGEAVNPERKFFKDKSGTIKDKVKFCLKAVELMKTEEWYLTEELSELCNAIWQHIEISNY